MDIKKLLERRCRKSSQVAVAAELGLSVSYLNDILRGRREPGPSVLRALGVERETRYRRAR